LAHILFLQHFFIVVPSTAVLSHRNPACAGTFYGVWDSDKRNKTFPAAYLTDASTVGHVTKWRASFRSGSCSFTCFIRPVRRFFLLVVCYGQAGGRTTVPCTRLYADTESPMAIPYSCSCL